MCNGVAAGGEYDGAACGGAEAMDAKATAFNTKAPTEGTVLTTATCCSTKGSPTTPNTEASWGCAEVSSSTSTM